MKRFTQALTGAVPVLAMVGSVGLVGCDEEFSGGVTVAELELSTNSVDFGDVQIGTSSGQRTVLVTNTGLAPVTLDGVVPGQPFDSNSFSFDFDTVDLPPNGSMQITAIFSPKVLGPKESVIVVRATIGGEQVERTITMRGDGVTSQLVADPERLSFRNVLVNSTKILTVELTNNSDFRADIQFLPRNNIAICGTNDPAAFCIQPVDNNFRDDEAFQLGSKESINLQVQFSPLIANTQERGGFTLSYCPQTACELDINMDGFSVEKGFSCEPQALDFGPVNPGASSELNVVCSNIANEQITVNEARFNSSSSPDFSVREDVRGVVLAPPEGDNPGGQLEIPVVYEPQELGDDEGTMVVTIDDDDPRRKDTLVQVFGSGGGPDIEVIPAQVNFGLVSLLAPARRTILIVNTGFEPLSISEIVVDSESTGAFVSPDASATIINPGQSQAITVEFQPRAEGQAETRMVIFSNDQDEAELEVLLRGEGINLPPCNFEVSNENLNFGVVEVNRAARRAFEIRNLSPTSQCLVTSVNLRPESGAEFSLPDGEVNSVLIPPEAALAVSVGYAPETLGQHRGAIEFSISNPDRPFNVVDLTGTAAESTLLIVPNDLFFGTIEVGCAARAKTVTVYNTGATPALIESIDLDAQPGVFNANGLPSLPLSLSPGASFQFSVGFFAPEVSDYAGAVEMTGEFNGQPVTYIISLQGSGDIDAVQQDRFEQLGRPEVDILFVIDNSCSMFDEQQSLASNFGDFVQFAEAQSLDYHLAVTTTDMNVERGKFVSGSTPGTGPAANRIVTPQTQPSPVTVFSANAQQGSTGAGIEYVLDAAYEALTPPNINGHNAGFLRREAVLSIVGVTDEREQSARTVDFFLNFFLSIKGFRNTQLFSFSAISGGETGCNSSAGSAGAAPRLLELAERTGGVSQTICTQDWSRTLEDLSRQAFGFKSRFFLTNQPVIQTIEVFVDETRLPERETSGRQNWSYDFSTNSVNFTPLAVPAPGSVVRIEYTAECL